MNDTDLKTERNARVKARYDELMREGRHGHYETMFQVVREEVERVLPASTHDTMREVEVFDALARSIDEAFSLSETMRELKTNLNYGIGATIKPYIAALSPQPQVTEEEIAEIITKNVFFGRNTEMSANAAARAIIARLTGSAK